MAAEHGTDSARARTPTVKDVAVLAGVSPMTVSRTFAGGDGVRPRLQERVLQAAHALGYRRNENARSIRPGQATGLIGVAITNIGNPYYGTFALGLEEVASRYGRRVILGNTDEDPVREAQFIADMVGRHVEGLVVVPSGTGGGTFEEGYPLFGTPVVLASRMVGGLDADAVIVDDVGGAFDGTSALLAAGHRRIGYLGNSRSAFTDSRRFEGYSAALRAAGVAVDVSLTLRDQRDADSAATAMTQMLNSPSPPTAVFCGNNRNTIGALTAIGVEWRKGYPVSSLPAIVGFDRFELAELMPVPVTIVDHDPRDIGRRSAELLFDRLSGAVVGPPRVVQVPTSVKVLRG